MGGCASKESQVVLSNGMVRSITKHPLGELYYLQEKTDGISQNIEGGTARVVLFFSLKSTMLSNLNKIKQYQITINMSTVTNQDSYTTLGVLGDIDEINLSYHKSFAVNYYFERNQNLVFDFHLGNTWSERINTTLGKIIGSKKQIAEFPLTKEEVCLVVQAVYEKESSQNMHVNLEVNATLSNSLESYFIFSNNIRKDNAVQRLYKSKETRSNQINARINNLKLNDVCLGDENMPINFEFYSVSKGILGKIQTSIKNIKEGTMLTITNTKGEEIGKSRITCDIFNKVRFIEYLEKGLQISLFAGIDFTASNDYYTSPNSLHYIYGITPNHYEQAIKSCGNILAYYDYDQRFPVFGFGAKTGGKTVVDHCFSLNFQEDPFVDGVDGILSTYRTSLPNVKFDGPTFFAPLIKNMIETVKQEISSQPSSVYYILLILTDGMIHDIDETRYLICEAAFLPISIIIIGIGNSDFSKMVELDGDHDPLIDRNGRPILRDIVQFVVYNQFKNDSSLLAAEVLFEIPGQIEKYYSVNKFSGI